MKLIYIFTTFELLYIFNFGIFFTKRPSCLIFYRGLVFAFYVLYLNDIGFPPLIHFTRAYHLTLVTLHLIDCFRVIIAVFLLLDKEN